ncbi:SDR family oxidoreductase [Thermoleophilia bacterium SCSIO 60948]|nr:SDR family oxidoreductase [Thermoleophilia bacterium SCSIO 60948]
MDLGLGGRIAAVTGASSGIGREVALKLVAEGASVLGVGRSQERLAQMADAAGAPDRVATLVLDVTDADSGERILETAVSRFGRLDVLVNNAGTSSRRALDELPDEDWYEQFELGVMAPMRAMRAAIGPMRERGWGRVVNVSSSAGKRPSADMGSYSVSKAAQLSLSRLYADEAAADGVLVNAICPGPATSELWMAPGGMLDQAARNAGRSREEELESAGAKRPIGRLAEPAEIADAIVFLCSERASYMSGAAISADGGSVAVII